MSTETAVSTHHVKKHPIRGAICGLILGLAVVIFLITAAAYQWTSIYPAIGILVITTVLGAAWGLFGPARGKSGSGGPHRSILNRTRKSHRG